MVSRRRVCQWPCWPVGLFAMDKPHLHHGILLAQMCCQMLCTIDAAMLTACATEADRQTGKIASHKPLDMMVYQRVDMAQKLQNLTIIFQKTYNLAVQAREVLILLIAPGVVGGTAVKNVAATIAGGVGGQAPLIAETGDGNG